MSKINELRDAVAKMTPAPWRLSKDNYGVPRLWAHLAGDNGGWEQDVGSPCSDGGLDRDEEMANGAAPVLLRNSADWLLHVAELARDMAQAMRTVRDETSEEMGAYEYEQILAPVDELLARYEALQRVR